MTTPNPAGWYPDPAVPGTYRYWNGSAWIAPAEVGRPAGYMDTPPPTYAPPASSGSDSGRKTAVAIGVGLLVVIGLVMSMQSVSLITGSGQIWTGVAIVAVGTALAFFMRAATWVRVIACLLLALALLNAIYIENELSKRRSELTQIFNQ
ncbi:MAG: DUF2510 domain-containing protein [Mycobacterium sp.]|nr:DUF2510 domain-containing protein [Mycobacterium sp.]